MRQSLSFACIQRVASSAEAELSLTIFRDCADGAAVLTGLPTEDEEEEFFIHKDKLLTKKDSAACLFEHCAPLLLCGLSSVVLRLTGMLY